MKLTASGGAFSHDLVGQHLTIHGDPKPAGFWARLWWYACTPIGGPKLFVQPRRRDRTHPISAVYSSTVVKLGK